MFEKGRKDERIQQQKEISCISRCSQIRGRVPVVSMLWDTRNGMGLFKCPRLSSLARALRRPVHPILASSVTTPGNMGGHHLFFSVVVVCGLVYERKWGMKKVRTTCRELDRATSSKEKTREKERERERERNPSLKRGPRIALGLSAGPTQQVMWQDRSRATRRNDRQVNWQPSLDGPLRKREFHTKPPLLLLLLLLVSFPL